MYEFESLNRIYSYVIYGTSIFMLLLSIVFFNGIIFLLSLFGLLLSVVYLHSGHIINNYLIKKSKVIEIYNGYRLGLDLTHATKRLGQYYQGIAIALFEPNNRMEGKNVQIIELLEVVKEPFEFSVSLKEINKKNLIEPLETKRRMKEIAFSRQSSSGSYAKVNKLKRELELMESEISHILNNGKSFEIMIKLKAIATAGSEIEAGREAAKNLESVANKFSATLGLDYNILKGEQLVEAIEAS